MKNKEQTVLITGATAGIGKRAALDLLARGHWVVATGRRSEALAALATEAKIMGVDARLSLVELDVSLQPSIDAALARVDELTNNRGIDVLINNAGYATAGALIELSAEAVQAQFDTNVFGLLRVTRAFGAAMVARRRGRIVNVGSVSGRIPAPMLGAYHASKYALEALTDSLRMELRPFGVDVVIVEPGTIRTDFADRVIAEANASRTDTTRYRSIYDRQIQLAAKIDKIASGPAPVSRALVRAVEAKRPRARVVAPARFLLVIALVRLLPVCWVDAIMRKVAGLDSLASLPAA